MTGGDDADAEATGLADLRQADAGREAVDVQDVGTFLGEPA